MTYLIVLLFPLLSQTWLITLYADPACNGHSEHYNAMGKWTSLCVRPLGMPPPFDAKAILLESLHPQCQVFVYTDANHHCQQVEHMWDGYDKGTSGCQTLGQNKWGKWEKFSVVCPQVSPPNEALDGGDSMGPYAELQDDGGQEGGPWNGEQL